MYVIRCFVFVACLFRFRCGTLPPTANSRTHLMKFSFRTTWRVTSQHHKLIAETPKLDHKVVGYWSFNSCRCGASTQEHHHFSLYCSPLNSALEETFRPTNLQDLPTISCLTLLCASSLCFWIPLLLFILSLCCWLFLFDKFGFHVIHCYLHQYTLLFCFLFNKNQVNSKETIKTTTGLEYNLFFHEIFNATFGGFLCLISSSSL